MENGIKDTLASYAGEVGGAVVKSDFDALAEAASILAKAKERGSTVFTAGNGGSMATASHMANDLLKGCRIHGRNGFRTICLGDSGPIVTCLANDFAYDDIFTVYLKTMARRGDILIVFSGSGNSPNVVKAAKYARGAGITIIGFLGGNGGILKELCDVSIIAPTDCMEQIEDMHLIYEHALVTGLRKELADVWDIEIIEYPGPDRTFKSALFDFDGTVSLIRQGWQDIMIPYFTEVLSDTPDGRREKYADLAEWVRESVGVLTGKQTIFQCMALNEEVVRKGGPSRDPMVYKKEYLARLMKRIQGRREGLADGSIAPGDLLVPGIREFLSALREHGISLYLASGTDDADVKMEAALLQIDGFFGGNIYGALDEHATDCTKELVIRSILDGNTIRGCELLSFGDGYVEVELVHGIGGYAVAVASDEARRKGIDAWKRDRLIRAGAKAVIPDFSSSDKLMAFIKKEEWQCLSSSSTAAF